MAVIRCVLTSLFNLLIFFILFSILLIDVCVSITSSRRCLLQSLPIFGALEYAIMILSVRRRATVKSKQNVFEMSFREMWEGLFGWYGRWKDSVLFGSFFGRRICCWARLDLPADDALCHALPLRGQPQPQDNVL